jgi:erythromycin esterase-like protein
LIGDARIVLLGEASHGTHEFYRERACITKRLIVELGFTALAIEGDWPDAHRVNRYINGAREDGDAEEALRGFRRFPTWMWRNADVLDLVGWLRAHNDGLPRGARKTGFYGLDLYSLGASMEAVVGYLDAQDPTAAARARARYECLQPYAGESASYGQAVLLGDSGRALREPRLERAIGVIYRPETERQSHWFAARAAQQFDALVHIDSTRAVEPLERSSTWELGEPPETYPSAL